MKNGSAKPAHFAIFAPHALVAQLDRVSASEVEGHAFESHQGYEARAPLLGCSCFIVLIPMRTHSSTARKANEAGKLACLFLSRGAGTQTEGLCTIASYTSFTISSCGSASTTSASRNSPTSASPSRTFTMSSFSMEFPSVRP